MTHTNIFQRHLLAGLALASLTLSSAAFADNADRAQVAIAAAKAKIETGDRLGTTEQAADAQQRARVALGTAESEFKRHHEASAYYGAKQADALAGLAMATAELTKLTTQRDQLLAR
jgi:opacity protein-like surface antigen